MVVGRRDEDVEADASPWATDQIVASPAPQFAWEQPQPPGDEAPPDPSGSNRRNQVLVAIGCLAALFLGTVALWPSSKTPTGLTDATSEPETTLGTLPSGNEVAADSASSDDGATEDGADDLLATAAASTAEEAASIQLPEAVAAIDEPTEIVLTAGGEIITVSLPSGSVRRAEASGSLESGVTVAPDAVAWFRGSNLNIIPRIGPALTVDLASDSDGGGGWVNNWMTDESGSTKFLVSSFGQDQEQLHTVSIDGVVEDYEPDLSHIDTFAFYGGLYSGAGNEVVNDAGGVYLLGADDDVERISTGRALAATDTYVLLRECDESLDCEYLVIDRATRERRLSPATTELLGASYGFDLSPDGTAVLTYDFRSQGRRLVDLVDGSVVAELEHPMGPGRNTQWAGDSSGVFHADPSGEGLHFIDRTSGESVQFAAGFGRISGLGTRAPDTELEVSANTVARRPITFSADPLGTVGLDIVVLGELGSMAHIDLDSGLASVWSAPATPGQHPPDLVAYGGGIAVLPSSGSDGFVSTLGFTTPLALPEDAEPPGYPLFPGPAPGDVWSPRDGSAAGIDHQVVKVDQGVAPANFGGAIKLANSELLGDDGNGQLVARVAGDIFVAAAIGTTKLTDGDLIALGPNHALVRTCDDSLRCSTRRIDRANGEVLSVGGPAPELDVVLSEARSVSDPGRSPRLSGTISPDGEAAVVRSGSAGTTDQWMFVDFSSGTTLVAPSPADGQPIIWNDDSSVAVYVSDGNVHLVERQEQRVMTVQGLGEVRSITAVGADFAGAEASGG